MPYAINIPPSFNYNANNPMRICVVLCTVSQGDDRECGRSLVHSGPAAIVAGPHTHEIELLTVVRTELKCTGLDNV